MKRVIHGVAILLGVLNVGYITAMKTREMRRRLYFDHTKLLCMRFQQDNKFVYIMRSLETSEQTNVSSQKLTIEDKKHELPKLTNNEKIVLKLHNKQKNKKKQCAIVSAAIR
jgi:hypothetical protein